MSATDKRNDSRPIGQAAAAGGADAIEQGTVRRLTALAELILQQQRKTAQELAAARQLLQELRDRTDSRDAVPGVVGP